MEATVTQNNIHDSGAQKCGLNCSEFGAFTVATSDVTVRACWAHVASALFLVLNGKVETR